MAALARLYLSGVPRLRSTPADNKIKLTSSGKEAPPSGRPPGRLSNFRTTGRNMTAITIVKARYPNAGKIVVVCVPVVAIADTTDKSIHPATSLPITEQSVS